MFPGVPTRYVRIACQWLVFTLWVGLILSTGHPMDSWLAQHVPVSLLLRIDPLVMTVVCGGMRVGVTILLLGFVTLAATLILGRVFCGWVCPLGAIFDAYGWVLRRLHVRIDGPSPKWFRFKYYLLFSMLILAAFGVVSPLMGFDPIVLLTRTIATVVQPFWRQRAELPWQVGGNVGKHGYLIDVATLILFLGIMSATTRLSRIWCRTACPLGAYLAVASRNSVLRRETKDCIHCDICATNCPTGAISLTNPEVYNESECIKCFSCTQDCPVDANFFTYKSPFPTETYSKTPVSLDRRAVLGAGIAAAVSAPIFELSAGTPQSTKSLIRPPMSREEDEFLLSCIRCNECSKACPTGVLKPASFEHGLRAFWTPILTPTEGYCQEGCNACSQACPTDAILKYDIADKYKFKSGTAVFDSSRCISYTEDKFCSECVRVCPTDAIDIHKGWEPPGSTPNPALETTTTRGIKASIGSQGSELPAPAGQAPTRPYHVNYDRCVGCGACQFACDQIVFGNAAMQTTSAGRATPTQLNPVPPV